MNSDQLTANWNYPTQISVGAGRAEELNQICIDLNITAPLLVTDPGLAGLPMTRKLKESCQSSGLAVQMFKAVKANPTDENVYDGVKVFREGAHDAVIAFGGGSAIDTAKAIALMVGQQGSLWDYEDIGDNWKAVNADGIAPVIAIPTTAGTGSEVGRASVITDSVKQIKKIIFHPKMMPKTVILDPLLTVSLPAPITAATGMDALSHNLEAYCAKGYHPMAQGIAAEGIVLIKQYLPLAFKEPNNLEARTHMLVASSMGATAFQKGLGAMHALAHPLGALYQAHHGRLNAILMPYVLQANRSAIETKLIRLSRFLQLDDGFDGLMRWILELRHSLGIEHSLAEIGIDAHLTSRIAEMAVQDAASYGNPIAFGVKDYQRILQAAIDGTLDAL